MAKKTCMICGNEIGGLTGKMKLKDGYVCKSCFKGLGVTTKDIMLASQKTMTLEEFRGYLEKRDDDLAYAENFEPTDVIGGIAKFNDDEKVVLLSDGAHLKDKPSNYTRFDYSQIVDYEVLENGSTIAKGGLGRAAVGGILFGGAGAIVGAATRKQKNLCESLQVKVTVKGYRDPAFFIKLITTPTKTDGFVYKAVTETAQKLASKLELIVEENKSGNAQQNASTASSPDPADQIRKFKALLDDGIISQEEFNQKKKQLLGI